MRITLKNIKYSAFASQETSCYEASLYFDGKKVGIVSNQGHGCDDVYYLDRRDEGAVEAYIKTLPTPSLETVCNESLNDWRVSKDLKTLLRKKVMALKDDGKIYTYKVIKPNKERVTRSAERVAKFENTVKVLNLLPFDEALKLYKEN